MSRKKIITIAISISIIIIIVAGIATGVYLTRQKQEITSEAQIQDNQIILDGTTVAPTTLFINQGETVTWLNASSSEFIEVASAPHPIHTDNPELNLGVVAPGESINTVFLQPGVFTWHDHLHPNLGGSITVAGSEPTSTPIPTPTLTPTPQATNSPTPTPTVVNQNVGGSAPTISLSPTPTPEQQNEIIETLPDAGTATPTLALLALGLIMFFSSMIIFTYRR